MQNIAFFLLLENDIIRREIKEKPAQKTNSPSRMCYSLLTTYITGNSKEYFDKCLNLSLKKTSILNLINCKNIQRKILVYRGHRIFFIQNFLNKAFLFQLLDRDPGHGYVMVKEQYTYSHMYVGESGLNKYLHTIMRL